MAFEQRIDPNEEQNGGVGDKSFMQRSVRCKGLDEGPLVICLQGPWGGGRYRGLLKKGNKPPHICTVRGHLLTNVFYLVYFFFTTLLARMQAPTVQGFHLFAFLVQLCTEHRAHSLVNEGVTWRPK